MKVEISIPEVVSIFKEIQEQPERIFEMIRVEIRENACYTLLAFICLKMELHWKSNPIGKVRKNLPFFKELVETNFTQKT